MEDTSSTLRPAIFFLLPGLKYNHYDIITSHYKSYKKITINYQNNPVWMQEESSIHLLDHTERIEPDGQVVIKDVVVVVDIDVVVVDRSSSF